MRTRLLEPVRVGSARATVALATLGIVVAALLLPGNAVGAQEQAACPAPGRIVREAEGWERIKKPSFPTLPQQITGYEVDPVTPSRIFATNGSSVMRSVDGGCRWTEVLRVNAAVRQIVVAAGSSGLPKIYVLSTNSRLLQTVIQASDDGGDTWKPLPTLFPPGVPGRLTYVPAAPNVLYLLMQVGTRAAVDDVFVDYLASAVFRSEDSGLTWSRTWIEDVVDERVRSEGEFRLTDIAVDPLETHVVWGLSTTGLRLSKDGAQSWAAIPDSPTIAFNAIDVFHKPGGEPRILALADTVGYRSRDGGETWDAFGTNGRIESLAHGRTADEMVALMPLIGLDRTIVTAYSATADEWLAVRADSVPRMFDASSDRTATPSFYMYSAEFLWRYRLPEDHAFDPEIDLEGGFDPTEVSEFPLDELYTCRKPPKVQLPPPPDPNAATFLSPSTLQLNIEPGGSQAVAYASELRMAPLLADVYFLLDTSESMDSVICGARHSISRIVQELYDLGVDAQFGVADYKGYQLSGGSTVYPYRRARRIGPADAAFQAALGGLRAFGGNPDAADPGAANPGEPSLTALYQSATGAGQAPWIPREQQAAYRDDAMRFIVHFSDERWPQSPPSPTFVEARDALIAEDIHQVGMSFGGQATGPLRTMARDTGAVALKGVDCDADGTVDIQPGDPLVCLDNKNASDEGVAMAAPIVSMIDALRKPVDVELVELTSSGVVADIDPPLVPNLTLKRINPLGFEVAYSCTLDQAGEEFDVELALKVGSNIVARAQATVACLPLPVPPPGPDDPTLPGAPTAPPAPPPPPPPLLPALPPAVSTGAASSNAVVEVNAPATQAQSQAQSQSQSQSQAQAQAAMAAQRQEQPQAALVQAANQVRDRVALENAMLRSSEGKGSALDIRALAGGSTVLLMAAFAFSLSRAHQLRRAFARARR